MLVGAETRDGGSDEIVIQHPLQQSSLALRGEFFGKLCVGANRATGLGLHGNDSDAGRRGSRNRGEFLGIVGHGVVDRHQRHVKHIQWNNGVENRNRVVR